MIEIKDRLIEVVSKVKSKQSIKNASDKKGGMRFYQAA